MVQRLRRYQTQKLQKALLILYSRLSAGWALKLTRSNTSLRKIDHLSVCLQKDMRSSSLIPYLLQIFSREATYSQEKSSLTICLKEQPYMFFLWSFFFLWTAVSEDSSTISMRGFFLEVASVFCLGFVSFLVFLVTGGALIERGFASFQPFFDRVLSSWPRTMHCSIISGKLPRQISSIVQGDANGEVSTGRGLIWSCRILNEWLSSSASPTIFSSFPFPARFLVPDSSPPSLEAECYQLGTFVSLRLTEVSASARLFFSRERNWSISTFWEGFGAWVGINTSITCSSVYSLWLDQR